MNEYNFAPDVDLYICDNYYEISVYGYCYYFSLDDLDTDHKVDILQLNSAITSSELEKLDPESYEYSWGTSLLEKINGV
jgi:hypothetical protein